MLLSQIVIVKWSKRIKEYYKQKGYTFTELGNEFEVKVEDLPNKSNVKIIVICDECGKEIKNVKWCDYKNYIKEDGAYYCKKCANKLYGMQNRVNAQIKNNKSFEQWCIENNRQDILDRWDYEMNKCSPNEIGHTAKSKYYFKCHRGLHKSELKNINHIFQRPNSNLECSTCNSFAQWGIDNICPDFLEKYWDYDKNTVNPWELNKNWKQKVWIKCQNKEYHGNYEVACYNFIKQNGTRCPYCNGKKVHKFDSLGWLLPQVLNIWSDKNEKSPYEYTPKSNLKVWWKCPEGKHEDYYRSINSANICNFRCPECQLRQGEERISNYLIENEFIKIIKEEYNNINITGKYYIPQMIFDNLLGIRNGLLSYDFYLPKYNMLIEYQGIQHEKPIDFKGYGKKWAEKQFEQQQEHDRRKRNYAKNNGIDLLEIWYYDFDRIEEILDRELTINNNQECVNQ